MEGGVAVPCGECTACCRSSQFVHIGREETETLARIPQELLFPAPGLPEGNVLLGYDEKGHCPMLVDEQCTIYEHRPRSCRSYDCRVFAAAGVGVVEGEKGAIAERAMRWKFSYPTLRDRKQQSALYAAARFLQERAECFPRGVPSDSTGLALLAIKVYDVFLGHQGKAGEGERRADAEIAEAVAAAHDRFETRRGESKKSR
jgi:hypothetical protein